MQKLEIKKLTEEKKDALAAQYAAEATLRRLHADQKEDDFVSLESVITPLEAEIKMFRNEVVIIQFPPKRLLQGLHSNIHFAFRLQLSKKIRKLWNGSQSQKRQRCLKQRRF